jgi:predicted esterase
MTATVLGFVHVYQPPTTPGAPTLLTLHGTGGDESDLLPLASMLSPGAGVLSPRGKVLEHGMPRFFRRLSPGVFDLDDLRMRTSELADFIERATAVYELDRDRIIAVGYSNGANIAANLLLSKPGSLRAAVLLRAMLPTEPEAPPTLTGTRVFISGGRNDAMIPQDSTSRLADLLRQAGADVTMQWDDGNHGLTRDAIDGARAWISARA